MRSDSTRPPRHMPQGGSVCRGAEGCRGEASRHLGGLDFRHRPLLLARSSFRHPFDDADGPAAGFFQVLPDAIAASHGEQPALPLRQPAGSVEEDEHRVWIGAKIPIGLGHGWPPPDGSFLGQGEACRWCHAGHRRRPRPRAGARQVIRWITRKRPSSSHASTQGSDSANVHTISCLSISSSQSPSGHAMCQPPSTAWALALNSGSWFW